VGASNNKPLFDILVDAHAAEIYRYLWRMLQNEQDAEDCLQEAFLKSYLAYDRLDESANYRAWLYRIAGNTARTRLSGKLRTGILLSDELADPALPIEQQEQFVRDLELDPALYYPPDANRPQTQTWPGITINPREMLAQRGIELDPDWVKP